MRKTHISDYLKRKKIGRINQKTMKLVTHEDGRDLGMRDSSVSTSLCVVLTSGIT